MIGPKLRHRVTIASLVQSRDEFGGVVETWQPLVINLPAEIVPLSGREFVAAQAVKAGVTTRITIRHRGGITAAMRVEHGADIYNIRAVLPDQTLRRHLTLMCETGVNHG